MAAQTFLLDSDSAGAANQFILDSDNPNGISIGFSSQQGQQAAVSGLANGAVISFSSQQQQQSSSALTNYAITILTSPQYTGPGSITYNGNFAAQPGDVVAYDPALFVYPDGEISAPFYGAWQAAYNDGTGWISFTISFAAWDSNPRQGQQSSTQLVASPQIAFTALNPQTGNFAVTQVGGISLAATQGQQSAIQVNANIVVAMATAVNGQTESMQVGAKVAPAFSSLQSQQEVIQIAAAPSIAFAASQGSQGSFNVVAPIVPVIAMSSQQLQTESINVAVAAVINGSGAQAQQRSMDVIVPFAPPIAISPIQSQQSSMDVQARPSVAGVSAQQPEQITAQILAFPTAAFSALQGQKVSVSLPNLPSPPIAMSATQSQQASVDLQSAPSIAFAAQQGQLISVKVTLFPAQLQDFDPELITIDTNTYMNDPQPFTKVIYLGRDNVASLSVLYAGSPVDLGPITHVQIELQGTSIIIDSNDSPDYVQWVEGSNTLKFKIGLAPVPAGIYPVSLIIYDGGHPEGQAIAGPGLPLLMFDFIQDRAA